MKKTLITLCIVTACYHSYAQTNTFPTSGNVGIGTTSPSSALDIAGTLTLRPATGITSNGVVNITTLSTSPSHSDLSVIPFATDGYSASGSSVIIKGSSKQAWYGPGGTVTISGGLSRNSLNNPSGYAPVLIQLDGGNVGVGDASPAYKLTVNSQGNTTVASAMLHGQYAGTAISTEQSGSSYYALNVSGGTTSAGGSGTSLLYVRADGSIGVGTTDPQGYKFAVNGSAIATSMTVKLYANWPDYVFKPAYRLLPLADVKTYIDKNQHLPDMPSADKVEKTGINLGEMNTKLLKKVEELTLYLIEKDIQLQSQQRQINELKKDMDNWKHTIRRK